MSRFVLWQQLFAYFWIRTVVSSGHLNLDLGIQTCFSDGLDMYAKAWLQFVFPIYINLGTGDCNDSFQSLFQNRCHAGQSECTKGTSYPLSPFLCQARSHHNHYSLIHYHGVSWSYKAVTVASWWKCGLPSRKAHSTFHHSNLCSKSVCLVCHCSSTYAVSSKMVMALTT